MYPLKELVGVDRRFEKSINLQLDLNDVDKINGYIPTQSSVAILKEYLLNVMEETEKASILIGPYGKGKSHLLLVLLAILNMEKTDLKTIVKKVSFVDSETGDLIHSFLKQKKRFLPVIISASNDDLNQAFLLGLHESLKQFGIQDISINSFYNEAVRVIEGWKRDFPDTYHRFEMEISNRGMKLNVFLKQLKEYREEALKLFQEIYPLLTSGGIFQPMVHVEIKDLYEEVCAALVKQGSFGGIYIIFDEFSKYIEGHKKETFAQDMKKIQDMCELANHSKKSNVFITFVAHKSMKEYGKSLDKSIINSFRGVEGRLNEKLFVISSQNNYELLTNTIVKKKKFDEICELPQIREIQDKTYQMDYFKTLFKELEYEKYIAKGCYPLTPLAAYMLLRISEKVAQNERTIFTFMTGDEHGSLYRILKEEKGTEYFVGADKIYDYFKALFKDNLNQPRMYNEWLKASYALTLVDGEDEKKILKALALFHMLRDSDEIVPNDGTLRLALGMEKEKFQLAVANLREKNVIVWRSKYGFYNFKNQIGIDLEAEVQKRVAKPGSKLQVTEALEKISVLDFVLPRAYNQKFTMTRFYRYVFMEEASFLKLSKSEYLFEELAGKNKFADGIILLLLKGADGKPQLTAEKIESLQDERLVVLYPSHVLEVNKQLQQIKAIEELLADKEFTDNNQVLIQELHMHREDLIYEVNQQLLMAYEVANGNCTVLSYKEKEKCFETEASFNNFLGNIFEAYYTNTPRVNNELLNVRNIGKQYRKARNTIVTKILDDEDMSGYIKGTSPEAIIYRAAFVHTGIADGDMEIEGGCREVLKQIEVFMGESMGKKISFELLMNLLTGKKYGAREGILPLFMAVKFASITSLPFIYLKNKEVELNAETLENICEKPSEYFLYVERESGEKEQYLQALEQLFVIDKQSSVYNRRKRVCIIVDKMQAWYRALPQVAVNLLEAEEKELECTQQFCKLLRKIEMNPRDLLFEKIPTLVQKDVDWQLTAETVARIKATLDGSYLIAVSNIIDITKETFGFKQSDNLCAALMEWYGNKKEQFENYIFSDKAGNLRDYLKSLDMYDEQVCIKRLTKIVLDIYLEDFTKQHAEDYEAELKKLLEEIVRVDGESASSGNGSNTITFLSSDGKKFEKSYAQTEEDSTSYFLKNAIESAMEEFGDSLDQNQKLAVLVKTIEELF